MNYLNMLIKPLITMWNNIALIIPASLVAWGLTIMETVHSLVQVEQSLVVGLIALMSLDLISGVYKALTNERMITSLGLRQTSIKFIEYTIALLGFVIIANMASMEWIKTTSILWLSFIELKSIVENLNDKKGVINELYDVIKNKYSNPKP